MFKIGQEVVCVKASSHLKKGELYTVQLYIPRSDSILVNESQPTKANKKYFWGWRFTPVISSEELAAIIAIPHHKKLKL